MSAKEYILFCKLFLSELKSILPHFNNIYTFEKDSRYFFDENAENISPENIFKIISFDREEDVFRNEDPTDKDLHINSTSWIGFNSLFFGNEQKNDEESQITITISSLGAYEKDKTAIIKLEFSKLYQKFINYEIIENITKLIAKYTNLDYLVAYSDEFFDKVWKKEYKLWLGWITFFNNPDVINLLHNDLIITKIKNGAMFGLSKEKINSKDSEIVSQTCILRDSLGKNRILDYPWDS